MLKMINQNMKLEIVIIKQRNRKYKLLKELKIKMIFRVNLIINSQKIKKKQQAKTLLSVIHPNIIQQNHNYERLIKIYIAFII